MLALSIRQPYAELILRGIKTAELRSRGTTIVGRRFYLYAAKAKAKPPVAVWSADLRVATPPGWMIELDFDALSRVAKQVGMIETDAELPTGVIVGSAVIEKVIPPDPADGAAGLFRWELADVRRMKTPRKPDGRPRLD